MKSNTIAFYFAKSQLSNEYMQEHVSKNFPDFLTGKKEPTFNQLIKISKIFNIPVGLLLLETPIEKQSTNIEFRTTHTERILHKSQELEDTIHEMEAKQSFLREEIDYELDFVGQYTIHDDYLQVAETIRTYLGIEEMECKKITKDKILGFYREKLNQIGIFVFINGKYQDNTHRSLNIDEFRGFVLVDKKAPVIFINQKDTKNAQLFTLIHELVHIFIGEAEILGDVDNSDQTEAFVNRVTAEILVPKQAFIAEVNRTQQNVKQLANTFKVSEYVIIRRLRDTNFIDQKQYEQGVEQLKAEFDSYKQKVPKSNGGSYRNNLKYRMDRKFFNYVENAILTDEISYTNAFQLLGVSYKGYKMLKTRVSIQ